MRIGLFAIQGGVIEHKRALEACGAQVQDVRLPEDLEGIAGIVLPGGESTTQSKLLRRFGLFDPLQQMLAEGLPVWGTCAGAILLSEEVEGKQKPETFGVMHIRAHRNAYGSHAQSFIANVETTLPEVPQVEAVFIRAPQLTPLGDDVEVLATHNDVPVLLKQGNMMASSFHPELTQDTTLHQYFLSLCA